MLRRRSGCLFESGDNERHGRHERQREVGPACHGVDRGASGGERGARVDRDAAGALRGLPARTAGAAAGATSIPITGAVRGNGSFAFPSGAVVQSDYAGPWDCYNMAAYAKANGYAGSMDFDLQSEHGAYNKSFPCLDQIALGLGLTH